MITIWHTVEHGALVDAECKTNEEYYYVTGQREPNHPMPVPYNYSEDLLVTAQLAIDGYFNPYA